MNKIFLKKTAARAALFTATVLLLILSFNSCTKDKDKINAQEHPKNTFIIDEGKKPVLKAAIGKEELDNKFYNITLYFSENEKDFVLIQLSKNPHDGKIIDLTKKDEKIHDKQWFWSVQYNNQDNSIFYAFGNPSYQEHCIFQNGTLYVKRTGETTEFEIKLENGKIKDDKNGDGKEHTVSLHYKGNLELVEE